MSTGRDTLAIELTYQDGEQRLLLAHWRLAQAPRRIGNAMFDIEAQCGCLSDFTTFKPCDRHTQAQLYRIIDATRPSGRKIAVR